MTQRLHAAMHKKPHRPVLSSACTAGADFPSGERSAPPGPAGTASTLSSLLHECGWVMLPLPFIPGSDWKTLVSELCHVVQNAFSRLGFTNKAGLTPFELCHAATQSAERARRRSSLGLAYGTTLRCERQQTRPGRVAKEPASTSASVLSPPTGV